MQVTVIPIQQHMEFCWYLEQEQDPIEQDVFAADGPGISSDLPMTVFVSSATHTTLGQFQSGLKTILFCCDFFRPLKRAPYKFSHLHNKHC